MLATFALASSDTLQTNELKVGSMIILVLTDLAPFFLSFDFDF